MAQPNTELPATADRMPGSDRPIAPGKPEAKVEVLVGRWLLLGCGATASVALVAAIGLGWVMIRGMLSP
ncbi:MAG: hypothetical protein FJ100_11920 [Deltaproteobacteria bacterium]|nr:hypothetical protein [Deltaproteobacteria bacterium]